MIFSLDYNWILIHLSWTCVRADGLGIVFQQLSGKGPKGRVTSKGCVACLQPWSGAPAALVQCSCSLGVVLLLERCSCSLGASVRIPPAAGLLPSHVFPGQNHRGNSTNHLQMTKMGAVKGKSKPAICFLIFLLLAFDLSLCLPKG